MASHNLGQRGPALALALKLFASQRDYSGRRTQCRNFVRAGGGAAHFLLFQQWLFTPNIW
jgi:hypothetical protein